MKKLTDDLIYVGVNDFEVDLFEGMYTVKNGMSYNSYVLLDKKTAVFDTVDERFGGEWLKNVAQALGGRTPDYLIINHMEPDHSANIARFLGEYPSATVVGNAKTFVIMEQYFGADVAKNRLVVPDGGTLALGKHELAFVFAPMVHWPEVMVTYDKTTATLFSADAFGKFGAIGADEPWESEARRYYYGIVGKFGVQVQAALKKLAALEIKTICPLHGPILTDNLGYYLDLYGKWSTYTPEKNGVMIAYTSVYGHTRAAAELLAEKLEAKGIKDVALYDLARCDRAQAVAEAFAYGKIVLATTTYNGGIFPAMREFIDCLTERNYQNRTVGIIDNGSWAPVAANLIKAKFEKSKDIRFTDTWVKLRAAVDAESESQLDALVAELS